MLTSSQIRSQFIDYFVERHGHSFVASSPVVPHEDPTLLFTNAGMNQFKDVFLGLDGGTKLRRAANSQKCIRAGGKHNDLEDVGRDTYHHTFFEMLGNWSFGDYFKKEAIVWAWELLTEVWGLDKSRLYATVYAGDEAEGLPADVEAHDLWAQVTDIDPSHISRWPAKDNFWEMGDTGPCGPCSEVHIDLTEDGSGAALVNAGDARVIELWNLVFIQFNRDATGKLEPLSARHVDTGLGLERLVRVIQGADSNYDTDLFEPLFDAIRQVTGGAAYGGSLDDLRDFAYRVIADHVRCLTFAINDGALPGNEGRGYVLRRILRRAVRHGYQTLGMDRPFLHALVPAVVDAMGEAFPELLGRSQHVQDVIEDEEKSFARTLDRGIALFEDAASKGGDRIGGREAFALHDTFGFPLDLTEVMAAERGMTVDVEGFARLMEEARRRARGAGRRQVSGQLLQAFVQKHDQVATQFTGYEGTDLETTSICLLLDLEDPAADLLAEASQGRRVALVAESSPFYAEAGGQVGDVGTIRAGADAVLRVHDTQKVGGVHLHLGVVEQGVLKSSADRKQPLTMTVDGDRRRRIMANHTGTHLLNRALRALVNESADQKGSLVDDTKLRFDFSHGSALDTSAIAAVEEAIVADIEADLPVDSRFVPLEAGRSISGLRAVFGEKYPDPVRVVSVGAPVADILGESDSGRWAKLSIEFCGGTHLARTSDADDFVINSEEAVAKGVRRITAQTGEAARQSRAAARRLLGHLAGLRAKQTDQLEQQVQELNRALEEQQLPHAARAALRDGLDELQKQVKQKRKAQSKEATGDVVAAARRLADDAEGDLFVSLVEGADAATLRTAMDVIRKKQPQMAMLLAAAGERKVAFLASVPPALIERGLRAGDWVREAASVTGGGGGGRADMAQAGGKDPSKLEEALEAARTYATSKLA